MNLNNDPKPAASAACGASWQVIDDKPNGLFTLRCRKCGVMVGAGGPPVCQLINPVTADSQYETEISLP